MSAIAGNRFHDVTKNVFRANRPRTRQPVRRCSYHAGEREQRRWGMCNTFGADEHNARMRAAEAFEAKTKQAGRRNGALGHVALEILRFMLRLRNRKTGRLDPSYDWLAANMPVRRSRSAVGAALKRLRLHGFLDWDRRTQPVEEPDSDQYVEQISNAYYFTMPKKAAELVARMLRRPSEEQLRRQRDAELERDIADRGADAVLDDIVAGVTDPEMRATLERLRASVGSANPPGGQNGTL